jgi:hypothetical protein
MRFSWLARAGLIGLLLAGNVAGGCGGDDSEASSAPSYVGEMTEELMTAAEGGEMELGAVKIAIPAGALEEDTEITLKIQSKADAPEKEKIAIDVYEFGPSLEFKTPVDVEFDLKGVTVPAGKRAQVAVLDEEAKKWSVLSGSSEKDGKVSGKTMHFSKFTVIFTVQADGSVDQSGGMCAAGEFDACGGDIVGTWSYSGACVSNLDLLGLGGETDEAFAVCDDKPSYSLDIDISGTATFGSDGSFVVDQTTQFGGGLSIPVSCLEQLAMGQASPEELCGSFPGEIKGDVCEAIQSEEPEVEQSTQTYGVEGGTLTVYDGADDAGDSLEYCVKGDSLTVRKTDPATGSYFEYTATRR